MDKNTKNTIKNIKYTFIINTCMIISIICICIITLATIFGLRNTVISMNKIIENQNKIIIDIVSKQDVLDHKINGITNNELNQNTILIDIDNKLKNKSR